jgi:hypothetical protein
VLDKLTVDDFRPAVGQPFAIDAGDGGTVELTLTEARTIEPGTAPTDDAGHRAPFALDFQGPADPVLPQAIYRIVNDAVGTLEIFVVPVGRTNSATNYEAIFT